MLPPDLTTITGGLSLLLIKRNYIKLISYIYILLLPVTGLTRPSPADPSGGPADPSGGHGPADPSGGHGPADPSGGRGGVAAAAAAKYLS